MFCRVKSNPTCWVDHIKTLSNWRHCYWRRSMARSAVLGCVTTVWSRSQHQNDTWRELCYTIIIPAYTIFNKQLFSLAPDIYKIGSRWFYQHTSIKMYTANMKHLHGPIDQLDWSCWWDPKLRGSQPFCSPQGRPGSHMDLESRKPFLFPPVFPHANYGFRRSPQFLMRRCEMPKWNWKSWTKRLQLA